MSEANQTPKIEVRNLKHNEMMSEETHCFSGTVYVDGKRFCLAWNHGHGGPTEFAPVKGSKLNHRQLDEEIRALGERLPDEDGYNFPPDTRFEIAVGNAVNHALVLRGVKRDLKNKVFALSPEGEVFEFNRKRGSSASIERVAAAVANKYPDHVVLNDKGPETITDLVVRGSRGEDLGPDYRAFREGATAAGDPEPSP